VEPGQKAWSKLRAEFGDSVFDANGHLDRAKLGELVFADAEKRRRLNEITHPEIQSKLFWATLNCLFQGGYCFSCFSLASVNETY
jgi:dephospho-CoA kinase